MTISKKIFSKLVLIAIGFLAGWFIFHGKDQVNNSTVQQVRGDSHYQFINPLIECEVEGQTLLNKYVPFKWEMQKRIEDEVIGRNQDTHLALYFRNLNNGPWFGIDEQENFAPASLLKVPLMIAYFKESESNPSLLGQTLSFDGADSGLPDQIFGSSSHLDPGQSYTVEELVRRMIVYSDNDAMSLLMKNFPKDKLYQIYTDLGVTNPYGQENDNVLSVRDYASFFRILYNAAYLEKDTSDKALKYLSEAEFKEGLVAGIPRNIVIAHKFGERALEEGEHPQQLHDCGIVYYKPYPYLICVMTRGNDAQILSQMIARTSKIVFEEVSKSYP